MVTYTRAALKDWPSYFDAGLIGGGGDMVTFGWEPSNATTSYRLDRVEDQLTVALAAKTDSSSLISGRSIV
jgi:hypothetical protein